MRRNSDVTAIHAPKTRPGVLEALAAVPRGTTLSDLKDVYVAVVLARNGGNRSKAARELGVCVRTVRYLLATWRGEPTPAYLQKLRELRS
jgi:DNA-binding NtrC family response regulator